jgi:tripartite-type tricarboxylate transporter receptor subunit TctC
MPPNSIGWRMMAARPVVLFRRHLNAVATTLLVAAAAHCPAMAEPLFPGQQITLIAPYPPGGVVDMTARLLAEGFGEKFGQGAIVINKPGANGMVGLADLVKAAPDGLTLLLNNDGGLGIPPAVDPNFKFDPKTSYTPVAQAVEYSHTFIVNSELPVKTVADFIAYAKARPGELNFGTPGIGTLPHIAMELFMQRTGTKLVHVPYKGAVPALTDLLAGSINVNVQSVPTVLGQAKNDRMRVLAVFSRQRINGLPDAPTMEESGLNDFVITSWLGVFGPPGLPAAVRDRLSSSIVDIVRQPKFQDKFRSMGFEPIGTDAATFAREYYDQVDRWKKVAMERGIKIDQ